MKKKDGRKSKSQSLQMEEIKTESQYMIRQSHLMILMIRKEHLSTEFLLLMKMENRKPESERVRELSIYGKEYLFRQMTGTNIANVNSGESHGQSIVTDTFPLNCILIIVLIKDRE